MDSVRLGDQESLISKGQINANHDGAQFLVHYILFHNYLLSCQELQWVSNYRTEYQKYNHISK